MTKLTPINKQTIIAGRTQSPKLPWDDILNTVRSQNRESVSLSCIKKVMNRRREVETNYFVSQVVGHEFFMPPTGILTVYYFVEWENFNALTWEPKET